MVAKPTPPAEKPAPPVEEKKPEPAPEPKPAPAPVEEKPNYNSGVLKTESFGVLDKIANEMKKDASVKFILNGHWMK